MEEFYLKIIVTNERFIGAYLRFIQKELVRISNGYNCGVDAQITDDDVIEVFIVYPEKICKEKLRIC